MPTRTILFETSGRPGWVALAEGDRIHGVRRLDESRRHARDLAPALRDLLTEAGWRPNAVEVVAVSLGPGGYTGLRVGVMSAKAFAFAVGCRVLGIDTFAAIAAQAPADCPVVEVLADAQQGKVYHQHVHGSVTGPLTVLPLEEWLPRRDANAALTGPAAELAAKRVPEARLVPAEWREPRPEGMLAILEARLARGEADDVWTIGPVYLRASSAEENWRSRQAAPSPGS